MIDILSTRFRVPDRPRVDVLSQLVLYYLVGATGDRITALRMLAELCGDSGEVVARRLIEADPAMMTECTAERAEAALSGLRAVGELAGSEGRNLDERCRRNPTQGRRLVAALPGMTQQRADWLLLSVGVLPSVAPTGAAMNVAARIGYPGHSYESIARSLDSELPGLYGDASQPGPEAVDLAWRAHHLFDRHGRAVCGPVRPSCSSCALREACPYGGEGADPAGRLDPEARSSSSYPPR